MADLFTDMWKGTKCASVRRVLPVWWIPCVLLLCIVNSCVALEPTAVIYPEVDLVVPYGQDVEMICVAKGNYTARELNFFLAGNPMKSEIYNDTAIRLFIRKPDEQVRRIFYCQNNETKYISVRTVHVIKPPGEVTDFNCISRNLDVLNCSWTTPDKILTNYSLSFTVNGEKHQPCFANFFEDTIVRFCYWNASSKPRYRQQEDKYYFTLEAVNAVGNRTQHFIVDHFSHVKPDPPMELKNMGQYPHSVLLVWSIPNNIHHFLPDGIEHKIEYQIAKIDDTSYFRQVNTSGLPSRNKTYKFNLTGLPYAHMQYGVRIYIKPKRAKSDEFWSDFSNIVVYTASEIPQRPPDTIAGAFDQNSFQGNRMLNIYWKQLEEFEEAGANFTYKILVTQGLTTKTYEPDKNKSLGYLSLNHLDVESLQAMEVRIRSSNEIGSSVNSSYLYIPAEEDTKSLRLSLFTKLAYENGTYELSWAGTGYYIDNYTLFWCQHNISNICTGHINFTVLEPTKTKHIIHLPRDYRYQFAISANKGRQTSGMIWAKCDISKDGIAMFDFPIHFKDHDAPGKSFVKLKWSMDCTLKEGIINGYNITYCPVKGTSTICDNTLGHPEPFIINDPTQMEAKIEDLRPYTTYQFTMALKTTYGLKTIENTTVRITTLEDTPTKPRNVTVSNIQYNSLIVSWLLPQHLNGHNKSIRYIIQYNENNRTVKYEDNKSFKVKLEGLAPFYNYTITLEACNEGINSCSGKTVPIIVRTRIGPPSKMLAPQYNNNVLFWIPPDNPGGTLDSYEIKIVKDGITEPLQNTTSLSHYVTSCEGVVQNVTFQVRAVNLDEDMYHGAWTDSMQVILPKRKESNITVIKFYGDWSAESTVLCKNRDNLFLLFIIMGVLMIVGMGCGILKTYKKIRKMGDIKPEFPKGLFLPEKDISNYPFSSMYPPEKDEKPTSDESLLLPNSKRTVTNSDIKSSVNENCGSSEQTDSTALSDLSQGPVHQNSTSDESTHSSIHLEEKSKDEVNQNEGEPSTTDTTTSSECSPYFSDIQYKKNKNTGYMQPVVSPVSGYVQASAFTNSPPMPVSLPIQPTTSSYVPAGLPPPIFTAGIPQSGVGQPPPNMGYIRAEDLAPRGNVNFPRLGLSPTKGFGPESLPTIPSLPMPSKTGADSSYIQLQSLDGLPSHKPTVRNVQLNLPASGYVRPEDPILNKHLTNFLSGAQSAEDSAILDPTMSPDACCRFSWSTDPANDNLHSLITNSSAINPSKN